ncbi:MAG: hypothetical protein PVS3B1_36640 [Ktedonobacteraceae bacterium]
MLITFYYHILHFIFATFGSKDKMQNMIVECYDTLVLFPHWLPGKLDHANRFNCSTQWASAMRGGANR